MLGVGSPSVPVAPLQREKGVLCWVFPRATRPACLAQVSCSTLGVFYKQAQFCPATVGPWSSALTQVVGLSCALAHMRWAMLALAFAGRC